MRLLQNVATYLLIFLALGLMNCGSDPAVDKINLLEGAWMLGSVTNDGVDVTNQFDGFALTLRKDFTYSTTNGGNAWPASGSFAFADEQQNQIQRDDNVLILIGDVTANNLEVSFNVNTVAGSGRLNGITGNFIFKLNK